MTETPLPRRVYFGAEDRPAANMPGPTREAKEGNHAFEIGRRHKLADRLIKSAEAVAAGVRIVRSLDATGHTRESLPHLSAVVADMNNAYEAFVASVGNAISRHELRDELRALGDRRTHTTVIPVTDEIGKLVAASVASHPAAPKPGPIKAGHAIVEGQK